MRLSLNMLLCWLITLTPTLFCPLSAGEPDDENCEYVFSLEEQPIRVSPLVGQLRPNRILVITSLDRQDRLKEQQSLRTALTKEIRELSTYDAIESRKCICERVNPIRSGRFDERRLVALSHEYLVDTVIFCQVVSIEAYRPMRLDVAFMMINIDQSVAVASGTLRFDLADPITEKIYHQSISADREDPMTASSSPSRLIEFAAKQMAIQIKSLW